MEDLSGEKEGRDGGMFDVHLGVEGVDHGRKAILGCFSTREKELFKSFFDDFFSQHRGRL